MWISPACYGHMTHHLRTLAGGKLVMVLEVSRGGLACFYVQKSLTRMFFLLRADTLLTAWRNPVFTS